MHDLTVKKRKGNLMNKRFVLFVCLLLLITGLFSAGRFLVLSESPKQSDVIIVLSGGQGRVEKAAELYKAGYAPYIILSNAKELTSKSGDMVQTALALGIPQDVIYTENAADSTYQNAEYTLLNLRLLFPLIFTCGG